jgi:hypothetical protein
MLQHGRTEPNMKAAIDILGEARMGWDISVYRQPDGDASPAKAGAPPGQHLAEWHTGRLDWLDELVKTGKAIDLGGDGYPVTYTVIAECVIPHIVKEDEYSHQLFGKPAADRAALAQCRLDEWLVVRAWDSN